VLAAPVLLLLAAGEPAQAEPSIAAQAELEACATRIEALKARQQMGRELDRLLRRAEELAVELERARAELPPAAAAPSPEELRERADAARDEVDRLAAEIAAVDVKLQDARRARAESGDAVVGAALGVAGGPPGGDRVRALAAERAGLAERRVRAEAEASRLEREARAAEAAEGRRR
jgi:chromosome segregation ATPase